jgi:hypothetical protein
MRETRRKKNQDVADWFWSNVNKDGPTQSHCPELGPCWEWTRSTDTIGYGNVWFDGRTQRAHRVAWFLSHGKFPNPPFQVLHKCDNKICCRDSHHFEGTRLDNMRDKVSKGRHVPMRGELNGNAALTNLQAEQIKQMYRPGLFGYEKLAKHFAVGKSTIARILTGQRLT